MTQQKECDIGTGRWRTWFHPANPAVTYQERSNILHLGENGTF